MGETLVTYQSPVVGPDGERYEARACGAPDDAGTWQGWIEFVPLDGGVPLRSPRETTQPNRVDTLYWATGLTAVYLEGALQRALEPRRATPVAPPERSMFDEPAPPAAAARAADVTSVLDPFSVYRKGKTVLRRQLAALSSWHLVNIALEYELTDLDVETLNLLPSTELIDLIVGAVRAAAEEARAR